MKKNKIFFHFCLLACISMLVACNGNDEKADAYGTFEAVEVKVSPEVNGTLIQFNINEGEQLEAGKFVGFIDTTDFWLSKEQLLAQKDAVSSRIQTVNSQIAVLNQQKENLLVDKKRVENLLKKEAATQKQLDDINGQLALIEKQIIQTQTQNQQVSREMKTLDVQILKLEDNIRKCYLKNPQQGVVLSKYMEANELATPSRPLYKLGNLDEMILRIYISGDQLSEITLGQELQVSVDQPRGEMKTLPGIVSWISPSAEFTPKTIQTREERVNLVYAVKVSVKNDGSLKIGMPAEVNFK